MRCAKWATPDARTHWGSTTAFVSYSNMNSLGYSPVTGGLFLGSEASGALSASGAFPTSQYQRNTVRSRFRYQLHPRVWVALGGTYGSGLPIEFNGTWE